MNRLFARVPDAVLDRFALVMEAIIVGVGGAVFVCGIVGVALAMGGR